MHLEQRIGTDVTPRPRQHRARGACRAGHRLCARRPDPGAASHTVQPVARYQALLRSVQELESTNAGYRSQIAQLRAEIDALESEAAARSATTQSLNNQVADLRAHAGLVAMHGPGIVVVLRNGIAGPGSGG